MPLRVYSITLETLRAVHPLLARFRQHDRNLFEQATRAGASILLNIAEGSLAETESLLRLAKDLQFGASEALKILIGEASEISRMLHALRERRG